ncbi:MAG: hypothetical protein ACRDVE_06450 [Actinocrinis sp.]
MSGQEAAPPPGPDEDAPAAEEIDAQQLLQAANRAIEAARREAARLFGSPSPAEPGAGKEAQSEKPGRED